jgi:hypothetical protein
VQVDQALKCLLLAAGEQPVDGIAVKLRGQPTENKQKIKNNEALPDKPQPHNGLLEAGENNYQFFISPAILFGRFNCN